MHPTTHPPADPVHAGGPGELLALMSARVCALEALNRSAINLVPSENRMSPAAQALLASDYSNRYCFNDTRTPGEWEFRGGEQIAGLEADGREAFSRLLGGAEVNLRPLSGLHAMMITLAGLGGDPGSTVVSIAEHGGGHYATAGLARRFGYRSTRIDCAEGRVDLDQLARALDAGAALVYLDVQNCLHVLDVAAVAELVRRYPRTRLHVDCSHTLGLVLGGVHPNPLDAGAGSVGGSLHKTFPGPHHGMLATRDPDTAARLRSAQQDLVSSHHFGASLAAARTALEFEFYGAGYAAAVVDNARALATALAGHGFDVAGAGYTDTHQVWVRLAAPMQVSERLARWGIRVNVQSELPGCPGPMWRLGTAEPTVLGAMTTDMHDLARVLALARDGHLTEGSRKVGELRSRIGQRPWWSRHPEAAEVAR